MVATFGASGRISHSVSSMATSHSSPRSVLANYGRQITRSLSLCCCHVSGGTHCNRRPATARRPAAIIRQRRPVIRTKALGASIQAFLLILGTPVWNPLPKRAGKPSRDFESESRISDAAFPPHIGRWRTGTSMCSSILLMDTRAASSPQMTYRLWASHARPANPQRS